MLIRERNLPMLRHFLPALALLASAMPAAAWGPTGHRASGLIAEAHISGRTRAHVALILGPQSLGEAATVPDEQRNNPDPFWQASPPWHRITLPRGTPLAQIAHPPEGDALTALDGFIATLRDPAADPEQRRRALQFVVHIVADLHLPVHVGDAVHGGGAAPVNWFGQRQSAHWLWDEGMINLTELSAPEYAARLQNRTTPAEVLAWWDHRPETYLDESIALRDEVYAELDVLVPAAAGQPLELGWAYQYRWRPAMERRLQQSGVRIAAVLDWVFAGR